MHRSDLRFVFARADQRLISSGLAMLAGIAALAPLASSVVHASDAIVRNTRR
jgi:hypothetical protein